METKLTNKYKKYIEQNGIDDLKELMSLFEHFESLFIRICKDYYDIRNSFHDIKVFYDILKDNRYFSSFCTIINLRLINKSLINRLIINTFASNIDFLMTHIRNTLTKKERIKFDDLIIELKNDFKTESLKEMFIWIVSYDCRNISTWFLLSTRYLPLHIKEKNLHLITKIHEIYNYFITHIFYTHYNNTKKR